MTLHPPPPGGHAAAAARHRHRRVRRRPVIPADPLASIVGERQMGNEAVVAAAQDAVGPRQQPRRAVLHLPRATSSAAISAPRSAPSSRCVATSWDRLPATLELTFAAMLIGRASAASASASSSARHGTRLIDHIARVFGLVGSSLPVFWLGSDPALHALRPARLAPRPGPPAVARRPAPDRSPACTPSTRCSTATSAWPGRRCASWCCRRSCSAGASWASSRGSCGPACSTCCTPTTCARRGRRAARRRGDAQPRAAQRAARRR